MQIFYNKVKLKKDNISYNFSQILETLKYIPQNSDLAPYQSPKYNRHKTTKIASKYRIHE